MISSFFEQIEKLLKQQKNLCSKFDMKDLGPAYVILGIKFINFDNEFILTRSHYVEKKLKKFNHYDVKLVSTPYDLNPHLKKNQRKCLSTQIFFINRICNVFD